MLVQVFPATGPAEAYSRPKSAAVHKFDVWSEMTIDVQTRGATGLMAVLEKVNCT